MTLNLLDNGEWPVGCGQWGGVASGVWPMYLGRSDIQSGRIDWRSIPADRESVRRIEQSLHPGRTTVYLIHANQFIINTLDNPNCFGM